MLLQLKADDEQGAEDGEEDGEDDVEEVEAGVEGEELAAGGQGVLALLRQVGVIEIFLLLHLSLLLSSQGVFFLLFSRQELILLVISKLVGLVRLSVAGSGSHFSTSFHCERLQWNDKIFTLQVYISDFLKRINGFLYFCQLAFLLSAMSRNL